MKSKEKQKDRGKDKKKNTKEKRIKNPRDNVKITNHFQTLGLLNSFL